jgi:hypothetical protein
MQSAMYCLGSVLTMGLKCVTWSSEESCVVDVVHITYLGTYTVQYTSPFLGLGSPNPYLVLYA